MWQTELKRYNFPCFVPAKKNLETSKLTRRTFTVISFVRQRASRTADVVRLGVYNDSNDSPTSTMKQNVFLVSIYDARGERVARGVRWIFRMLFQCERIDQNIRVDKNWRKNTFHLSIESEFCCNHSNHSLPSFLSNWRITITFSFSKFQYASIDSWLGQW